MTRTQSRVSNWTACASFLAFASLSLAPICRPASAECFHPAGGASFGTIGDLNGNGQRNVADALCGALTAVWSLGNPADPLPACLSGGWIRADLNCDGDADVSDVVAGIQLIITGSFGPFLDPLGTGCPQACAPCAPPGGGSCLINGCVPEGQEQPGQPCWACDPDSDAWGYSALPDGSACEGASGKQCQAAACVVVPPSEPSIAAVTPDVESALVAFSSPVSNGGDPPSSYRVVCTPTAGGASVQATGAATPIDVTGLSGGVEYTCVVLATNSAGEGPPSAASSAFTALSSGPPGTSQGDCLDWSALGWDSREACLRDGNWHSMGTYTAGSPVPASELAIIDALIKQGADIKIRAAAPVHAIFSVERVITDCGVASRSCLYVRRENALGFATMGLRVTPDTSNGEYWIGTEGNVGGLNDFFLGTDSNLTTGFTDYTLFLRAGRWHEVGTFAGGVGMSQATFDAIRASSRTGTRYKVMATSNTTYSLIHPVVRTIPNCGTNCLWMYARREDNDQGEKTIGFQLSTGADNGNYWIGDAVTFTDLNGFFSGTTGSIATGVFSFRLFAEELSFSGEPSFSDTCSDWSALGWSSQAECLSDGRSHTLFAATGGVNLSTGQFTALRQAGAAGVDLRIFRDSLSQGIFDIHRVIPNCQDHRVCLYARREYGSGWGTLGLAASDTGNPNANGYYWLGTAASVTNLSSFFEGTASGMSTGNSSYTVLHRPRHWHSLVQGGGGVGLTEDQFADVYAMALRGADFKIRPLSGTNWDNVFPILRIVPGTPGGYLWFYARREQSDGGHRVLGFYVGEGSLNGNFWMGDALSGYASLAAYAGGTSSSGPSGTFTYELLVSDPCVGCTGEPCASDGDCLSGQCGAAGCAPRACTNGQWDAGETGLDCGGASCAPCVAQGASCLDILTAAPGSPSGYYSIDPDGAGPEPAQGAWCDMATDGGGWTVVLNATRPSESYFASNYSNFIAIDVDSSIAPSPSQPGHRLQAFGAVPFTEVAALSIDGGAFVPNCAWDVASMDGFRIDDCNWSLKADQQGYVGLQSLGTGCYGADFGLTGVIQNYASAGPGATGTAIHTQWSVFGMNNDGITDTVPDFVASRYATMAVYNAEYRYYNVESCRTGSQQPFNGWVVAVR